MLLTDGQAKSTKKQIEENNTTTLADDYVKGEFKWNNSSHSSEVWNHHQPHQFDWKLHAARHKMHCSHTDGSVDIVTINVTSEVCSHQEKKNHSLALDAKHPCILHVQIVTISV